jgi:integrase
MRKKLTALAIPTLPPGEHPDPLTPGLILRVGANRRTWVCRYRQGGKRHRVVVGYYPAVRLADARETASALLKRVEAGLPAEAEQEAVVHPQSPNLMTVGKLIDKYEKMKTKEGVRIKRLPVAMRTIRNGLDAYLATPLSQFSKADLRAARDAIFERAPIQANRFMAYFGPVMRWAAQEDHIDHNFHGDLRKGKERKRQRVLTDAEIKAIWHASFNLDTGPRAERQHAARAYGRLVRFLLLSLQRLDEGASLRHGDVLDGQWRFMTKGDQPHRLRLPTLALDQIGTGEARVFCFHGKVGKITGLSKLKASLDEASGVSDWRHHDLRRSGATRLEEIGTDAALVHFVLNHSRQGLSAVYLQSDLFERMGKALSAWADEVTRIVGERRAAS